MDTLLAATTDGAQIALYDPAALPDPLPADGDALDAAATRGRLLLWATAADGHFRLRLLVDAPLPPELRGRDRHGRTDLLLRLPSGRLAATDAAELGPDAAIQAELPPGEYHAEAFEVAWTRAERAGRDPASQRAIAAAAGSFAWWLHGAYDTWCLFGTIHCGLAPAALAAIAFTGHDLVIPAILHHVALVVAGFWAVTALAYSLPPLRAVRAARRALLDARPQAVVALHPVTDRRPDRGGTFGAGA